MKPILYQEIPSLDLADFKEGDAASREKFVKDLGDAYQNIGFVAIKNHGLSDELTAKLYESIQKFFGLGEETKTQYEFPELFGQRGYIRKGKEKAKGRNTGDLKEFFHFGQNNPPTNGEDYPENPH